MVRRGSLPTIIKHFHVGSGRLYGRGNLGSEKPLEDLSFSFSSFILARAIWRERFSASTWFICCLICLRSSFSSSRSFFTESNSLSSAMIYKCMLLHTALEIWGKDDDDDDDYLMLSSLTSPVILTWANSPSFWGKTVKTPSGFLVSSSLGSQTSVGMDPGEVMFAGTLSSVSLRPTRSTFILKWQTKNNKKQALIVNGCLTHNKSTANLQLCLSAKLVHIFDYWRRKYSRQDIILWVMCLSCKK